jgi:hypothetical protein
VAHPSRLHDLACVLHLHSTYSDGTGTVAQIAAAGRRAGADVVMLTDHDTLEAKRRGEERWWGPVLLVVGEEVSPRNQNHFLAFGIEREISRRLPPAGICDAVADAGGFGFAAHPFSRGSDRFERISKGFPWRDLDCAGLRGVELWSYVTDTAERVASIREAAAFVARPSRFVDHPPAENVAQWDRMCSERTVVAVGGLDAHQYGLRVPDGYPLVGGRVPIRLMGYHRTFRHLRTHVLCDRAPTGELEHDREQVYAALRSGRCYLAMDSLAPGRGFAFWAEGPDGPAPMGSELASGDWTLEAWLPRRALLRLVRDGEVIERTDASTLTHRAEGPGVYRVEARLSAHGRERTWLMSNPIYLR